MLFLPAWASNYIVSQKCPFCSHKIGLDYIEKITIEKADKSADDLFVFCFICICGGCTEPFAITMNINYDPNKNTNIKQKAQKTKKPKSFSAIKQKEVDELHRIIRESASHEDFLIKIGVPEKTIEQLKIKK